MLNNDKNYATITIAKTSSGLKSFRATKNERRERDEKVMANASRFCDGGIVRVRGGVFE